MVTRNSDFAGIDFKELFSVLTRKLWIILTAGIIGAAALGCINLFLVTPFYTSTAKIYVINRQDETKTTYSDLQTGTQLTQDYMILLTSRPVLEQVIKNSEVSITPDELAGMISVVNPEETRILEISVTDYDPSLAKRLADAIAVTSSDQLVRIMEIEKINIMEYGNLPSVPVGRNIPRSFIMGGLLGMAAVLSIIVLFQLSNDNIRTSEDIEHYLGIITLGTIPAGDEISKRKHRLKYMANVN